MVILFIKRTIPIVGRKDLNKYLVAKKGFCLSSKHNLHKLRRLMTFGNHQ
jgi:hypothetical protein